MKDALSGIAIASDVPASQLTRFQVGGSVRYVASVKTRDELIRVLRYAKAHSIPCVTLGGGMNTLIQDSGFGGIGIKLAGGEFVELDDDCGFTIAGAGVKIGTFINYAISKGYAGPEQLAGVPGTIGGALVCNAGGNACDIGQWASWYEAVTDEGATERVVCDNETFKYRSSSVRGLVVKAAFEFPRTDDKDCLRMRYKDALEAKRQSQPLRDPSCGCIFKNPRGIRARTLIGRCGLLEKSLGGARISDHHANFITASPGCSSIDVISLIYDIVEVVQRQERITLETEVRILGAQGWQSLEEAVRAADIGHIGINGRDGGHTYD